MIRLLVIADDFTGALDAGVQLSSASASTKVIVSSFPSEIGNIHGECEVLVIDAETRHLKPKEAWGIVHGLVDWAVQSGIHTIYKKTDSALRGNIGAELEAVLSASGEKQLIFAPAFPKLHRITKAGIHYINGLPVSESDFGKDPYEAVTSSSVSEVLAKTSTAPSFSVTTDSLLPSESGILVFDVSSDTDFKKIADALPPCNRVRLLAGCAGFATILPGLLSLHAPTDPRSVAPVHLLAVCGSINPVSERQCALAETQGAPRIHLDEKTILNAKWMFGNACVQFVKELGQLCEERKLVILDTFRAKLLTDDNLDSNHARKMLAHNLGLLVKALFDSGLKSTALITGGDALLGLMRALHINVLYPVCEIEPGVVLSRFHYQGKERTVISKAGGFGSPELFLKLTGQCQHKYDNTSKESYL